MEKGSGKMVCQLNNATRHEAADGNMKAREKCYFFDLQRDARRVVAFYQTQQNDFRCYIIIDVVY